MEAAKGPDISKRSKRLEPLQENDNPQELPQNEKGKEPRRSERLRDRSRSRDDPKGRKKAEESVDEDHDLEDHVFMPVNTCLPVEQNVAGAATTSTDAGRGARPKTNSPPARGGTRTKRGGRQTEQDDVIAILRGEMCSIRQNQERQIQLLSEILKGQREPSVNWETVHRQEDADVESTAMKVEVVEEEEEARSEEKESEEDDEPDPAVQQQDGAPRGC